MSTIKLENDTVECNFKLIKDFNKKIYEKWEMETVLIISNTIFYKLSKDILSL